jgi:hypothetical protein
MKNKGLGWDQCFSSYTEGASAVAGETEGFCARVKELNPQEKSSYCILHMANHASRELLVLVNVVMKDAIHFEGFVNVRILSKTTAARLAQILALIICIYFSIPVGFHSIIFLTVLVFSVLLRCFGNLIPCALMYLTMAFSCHPQN